MKKDSLSVAVVILNFNGESLLKKFLPSVVQHTPSEIEIVVIDNGSNDGSVRFLKENFERVRIVLNQRNEGFAGGYNRGLESVNADIFILINSDVEVTPGWTSPLIHFLENHHSVGVVQPKILSYKEPQNFEYAGGAGGYVDTLFYPFCRGRVIYTQEEDKGQYDTEETIFWASGAAFCVRANLFKALGGFDPYFFAHQEEIDLCWRVQRLGYDVYAVPKSVVYHLGGATLDYEDVKKMYLNHRNGLIMLAKNLKPFQACIHIVMRLMIEQVFVGLNKIFKGNFKFYKYLCKAHIDFLIWLFEHKKPEEIKNIRFLDKKKLKGCMHIFIVVEYFFKKNKVFSRLKR